MIDLGALKERIAFAQPHDTEALRDALLELVEYLMEQSK